MLKLALRKLTDSKEESNESEEKETDALEQAMSDFKNATTSGEQAAAFRAALELAK
tara:strand:+ start:14826 stop:14993 length:168 start_codon:yes stop_codon:yes gene_type:complete